MTRIAFPIEDKDVQETDILTFDYSSALLPLETLTSATLACSVVSGIDPSPASVLSGGETTQGSLVMQKITGGVAGVSYHIRCVASTTKGRTLVLAGVMNVVSL